MAHIPKVHVASGNFMCDTGKPLILQAFLSSCVGVAAYDSKTNIGGLSHFLLPEPVSVCHEGDEGKYASTGLPLFLDKLMGMGASPDNLRAVVAGGAFSGVLSQQDINLDIGGRTADTVKSILSDRNIPIERSETGGFFTCCLSLNMTDWSTDISPPGGDLEGSSLEIPKVSHQQIDSMMGKIQPIPQVALKILRMLNHESADISTLANEVKKDQVISGQVLKYCNSVIFSGKGGIDSIGDALLIIGLDNLARIVTAIAVQNLFSNQNKGYSLVKGGLYHHAIGVALISEKIVQQNGRAHAFSAYSAGLLHDLGKTALDQFVADHAPFFYRDMQKHASHILTLENTYLGTDHTVVGHRLSRKWSLPDSIAQTIRYHHSPQSCSEQQGVVEAVALADLLFHMFSAGPHLTRMDLSQFEYLITRNGFHVLDFPRIVDMIPVQALTTNPEMIL